MSHANKFLTLPPLTQHLQASRYPKIFATFTAQLTAIPIDENIRRLFLV